MKKFLLSVCCAFFVCSLWASGDRGEFFLKYCRSWKKNKPVLKRPKGVSEQELDRRLKHFLACIKKFAPHWLAEFESIDRAFGWEKNSYAKILCFGIDYKKTPSPHECTSWIIMPDLTGGKQMILHKNRDSSARYLAGSIRSVPGKYSWIGHGNFGNIGVNNGINSCGLAVAMNSGDRTRENNTAGLNTVLIARILLEECADANSAVKLLEEMLRFGAYAHGQSGSMWFLVDGKNAFVVEHNAKYIHAGRIESGLAVRANAWKFPEMVVHSLQIPEDVAGNNHRVYAVRKRLIHDAFHKTGIVTPGDSIAASRITKIPEAPKSYPLCGSLTVSAATFVIDREFPKDLSYVLFAFGPPRHTVYIPLPSTLKNYPEKLLSGSFSNEVFKRFQKKSPWKDEKELQAFEAEMSSRHQAALDKARKLLKSGVKDARKQAARLLEKTFWKNWQAAEKFR